VRLPNAPLALIVKCHSTTYTCNTRNEKIQSKTIVFNTWWLTTSNALPRMRVDLELTKYTDELPKSEEPLLRTYRHDGRGRSKWNNYRRLWRTHTTGIDKPVPDRTIHNINLRLDRECVLDWVLIQNRCSCNHNLLPSTGMVWSTWKKVHLVWI
jgi:hypothetical protein